MKQLLPIHSIRRIIMSALFLLCTCMVVLAQPGGYGGRPPGGQFGGRPGPGQMNQIGSQNRGYIVGSVVLSPENKGEEETPGVGVTVTVVTSKKDTLFATVGDKGTFFFRYVPTGRTFMRFSMIGYEDQAKWVTMNPGENKVVANLKPIKYAINEAVLKEKVAPMTIKGDTIIFNAAAAKTEKGDMAIDILEQMPGVEVSESSITVLDEKVENVYIDGALLFGEAPMKALNNLPSEEVITIKSYQEYANKDPHHKISKNEDKQRVLDIQTKSKPKFVANIDALAGAGFDTDSTFHKFRYTVGANVMATSETLQANVRFNLNNINDGSTRQRDARFRRAQGGGSADLRSASFGLDVNRKWMSPTTRNFVLGSVGASYSYSDEYNVSESITKRIYFPTGDYNSRSSESKSYSATGNKSHKVGVNAQKALKDGSLSANLSFSASDGLTNSKSSSYNYQDDLPKQGTSSSNESNTDGTSWSARINASKGFWDKLRLSSNVSYSRSNSDKTSAKIDTTTSTITTTVLDIDGGSLSHSLSLGESVRYEITDRTSIKASYEFDNSYSRSTQYAYDITDPANRVLDEVNTQLRTIDNNTHKAGLTLRTTLFKDKVIMEGNVAYKSVGLNREDSFPVEEPVYSRRFNSVVPSLRLNNNSQLNHWEFEYNASNNTPSIEQLRPRINNNNLYSVSVGNPNLKQSNSNLLSFEYSTILGKTAREEVRELDENNTGRDNFGDPYMRVGRGGHGGRGGGRMGGGNSWRYSTLSFSASLNIKNDVIVNRRTYYAQESYLADYDYTMPAQSTLSTYENADNAYSASARVSWGQPLKHLGGTLTTTARMSWDSTPSYVNSNLTVTDNLSPSMSLRYMSTFSRRILINLVVNGSYVYSFNNAKDATEYFTESLNAGLEFNNILKHGYVSGNYTKSFMQGIEYTNVNDNILDLRTGARFGPRNNYDISVQVHDLFNRTSGFSTSMNSDYVTNKWTHNFGRYVMFKFAYRFNRLGRGGHGGPRY